MPQNVMLRSGSKDKFRLLCTTCAAWSTPLSYSRQYAAHMEDFRIQIGQIGHNKYEDRLYNTYMIRETCHQPG